MRTNYHTIVLGLGGIGSAAAYWSARRYGTDVLGLEQFELGHHNGGSQDHSRIIRLSYHTPGYVAMAKEAYRAWSAVEADVQESLILKTGGLDLWPAPAAIPMVDYVHSLTVNAVPFEQLDAAEVMHRWPQFRLATDVTALYQAESGIAPAARCNAAHLRLARAYGATLRDQTPVVGLRTVGNEVEVTTLDATYRCQKLVIAAGAWSNQHLAHFGLHLPLTVTQEQVTYFTTPHLADFAPNRFPIWIWMDEPCYYGFPVYGEAAVKGAQDVGGAEVTAETRTFTPDPVAQQRLTAFLAQQLPTAVGPILYTKTCLYTLPPDRDFVIDTLPAHPNVAVAIGAGHAFKFASLIGKTLAALSDGEAPSFDPQPFAINRPILQEENPPRHFMV